MKRKPARSVASKSVLPIRCSKIPAFLECPSSALPAENPYNPTSEAAREGSAGHDLAEWLVHHTLYSGPEPDLEAIASRWEVDIATLGFLGSRIRTVIADLGQWLPHGSTEARVEGEHTKGTADWIDLSTGVVVDWKMGHEERDPWGQLKGYCLAIYDMCGMPEVGHHSPIAAYARLGTHEVRHYNESDLLGFREKLLEQDSRAGRDYAPGNACTFCEHQLTCDARRDWLRSSVEALMPIGANGEYPVPSDQAFAELGPRVALLETAIKRYRQMERERLQQHRDGLAPPLEIGDGKALILKPFNRRHVDALKAWEVLTRELTPEQLNACVTVSLTKVGEQVAAVAPRGQKGRVKKAVIGEIEDAGAVSESTHYRRGEVRLEDLEE
jgi:hypothetical protein